MFLVFVCCKYSRINRKTFIKKMCELFSISENMHGGTRMCYFLTQNNVYRMQIAMLTMPETAKPGHSDLNKTPIIVIVVILDFY